MKGPNCSSSVPSLNIVVLHRDALTLEPKLLRVQLNRHDGEARLLSSAPFAFARSLPLQCIRICDKSQPMVYLRIEADNSSRD